MSNDLGEKIKILRAEKGWSMRQLAVKADIDPSMISDYEGGKVKPRYLSIAKLARAFGMTIDELSKEFITEIRAENFADDIRFNLELFDKLVQQLHDLDERAKASLIPLLQFYVDQIDGNTKP